MATIVYKKAGWFSQWALLPRSSKTWCNQQGHNPKRHCRIHTNTNLPFQAGKYPWIAAYLNSGQNPGGCAGTLVAAEWVVTAAHCLPGVTKDNLKIILGEYDLTSATDSADTNR